MKDIYPILVGGSLALFGVLITNLYNWTLHKSKLDNENNKELHKERKANGEELFSLFSTQQYLMSANIMTLLSVMEGKLNYNQYLDAIIEDSKSEKFDSSIIELITKAYFEKIIPDYEEVRRSFSEINLIISQHKAVYIQNGLGGEFRPLLSEASIKFESRAVAFKQAIIKELKVKNLT